MKLLLLFLMISGFETAEDWTWVTRAPSSTARLRGLSIPKRNVVWASGTGGTVVRLVRGNARTIAVPDAEKLDFRDVEGFDENSAVVLSIGAGDASRIYSTDDGGQSWTLRYRNTRPEVFLDAMAFWDRRQGIAMGDPVNGRYFLLRTEDGGRSWNELRPASLPEAVDGEAAFAASGTCIVAAGTRDVWIATGGSRARVFHSADRGLHWRAVDTPLIHGLASAGAFSLAFAKGGAGVVVGGDYQLENAKNANAARTADGGRTWTSLPTELPGYRSGVTVWMAQGRTRWVAVGPSGSDVYTGKVWSPIGTEGFHVVASDPNRATVWAAGNDGRIAELVSASR